MIKYIDKEGNFIKTRKIIYMLFFVLSVGIGAWLLHDAKHHSEPSTDKTILGENPKEDPKEQIIKKKEEQDASFGANIVYDKAPSESAQEVLEDKEDFHLKNETEYIQLRLSVTSSQGRQNDVASYLKEELNTDIKEDSLGNTYLALSRSDYDEALSAIIECPHTENVVYKNEDYYPVACEIYNKAKDAGSMSSEAIDNIENIEKMCKNIIIVVN